MAEHVNSLDRLEIIPSGRSLAAEVRGVDFSQPVPADLRIAIFDAWMTHLVLLFRGQSLTDASIVDFADLFGGSQVAGSREYFMKAGFKPGGHRVTEDPRVNFITNLDEHGNPKKYTEGIGSLEIAWHTDNSYTEVPPTGTLLWAERVPVDGGGETLFCNMYEAYESLPEDLKQAIEGKHIRHDTSRNTAGRPRPNVELPESVEEVEGPVHPIVRIHPETGKRALYLGRRWGWPSSYIVEQPDATGEELLDRLWAHATQDKLVWTQSWQPGDLVLWDNRSVMHRRNAIDPTQARVLHRCLIKGDPVVSAWQTGVAAE